MLSDYHQGFVPSEDILEVLRGWNAYAKQGNTYGLRKELQIGIENILLTLNHPHP